ncbi:sigma-70 family RNA polymerase sigma factor [Caulobacter sp.]|uniref:sigma-70 family RNA polymerase sigma factor n=1 Tax=Caulobacter sp. TaxID=78 RepID=UPI003BA8B4E9
MTASAAKIDASRDFQRDLIALIPHMRAFARSLCGNPADADDLAQDAVAKAWKSRDSFQPGTNLKAWTFMILRNQFYSDKRRSWRSQPLDQEVAERTLVAHTNADDALELDDVRQALAMLPDTQREALIMVGAGGFSYEEAAEVMGVAVGTVKSRVSRARADLQAILATGKYDRDGQPAGLAMGALLAELQSFRIAA